MSLLPLVAGQQRSKEIHNRFVLVLVCSFRTCFSVIRRGDVVWQLTENILAIDSHLHDTMMAVKHASIEHVKHCT